MNPKKSPQDTYNQFVESQRQNFENSKRKVTHYIQRSPLTENLQDRKNLFKVLKEKEMPPRYTISDKTFLQNENK